MNVWDILITALLIVTVLLAFRQLRKQKACTGQCSQCGRACQGTSSRNSRGRFFLSRLDRD